MMNTIGAIALSAFAFAMPFAVALVVVAADESVMGEPVANEQQRVQYDRKTDIWADY
jgi:hypothetical protein